ncbi:fungal-specific transcription factor domain-containing protein [Fusarium flagelliforme]|uniref:fungal-specific transcription factor domain-containing protein n=1 Tax=Fusarium flagelliforme TaxID=2675880 RepID=UPI001E8CDC3F|nr:fungal-specific transcription factor domain-containing protein [Fusarium flagelliforme]KAH7179315.1 fungal-specific transcription factor domain-containing protein [Fusarium flagelliforme]
MSSHHSPYDTLETSHSTPSHEPQSQKRKHSTSGREYGLMRDTGEHDAARFVGSGSGIHYIRAVHLRLAKRSASRTEPGSINTLIPGEDDQLRQDASTKKNQEQFLWKDDEICLNEGVRPSFEDFVEWSKSYFEAWHPVLPFLHGPEVLGLFEEVAKSGISSLSSTNRVIVKSILSISLADSRQSMAFEKSIPKQFLFNSVDDALASSQFALTQPASLRTTQAALAVQLFLTSMLCLNAASRLGGLIVRAAFQLGLHRCPARYPFFTTKDASARRRVFWCIYILERLLCQSLGLPLDIRDDDLDVCYPGEERHALANRDENSDRLQLLTFVTKHARIRGLILELRNKSMLQRQDTADRAAFVQAELAKWFNEIQDAVEEDDLADGDSTTPGISEHHKIMLLVLKHESAICLNRPGLASDHPSASYSSAFQACISAAKSILIILKKHRNRHQLQVGSDGSRSHTPLLWPSFTWSIWISAFVLIHAAFERQVPLDSALRHVAAAKSILGHLAARDTSWPEYCLGAIDELTSTVQELSQDRPPLIESPVDASITTRTFSPGLPHQQGGDNATPSRPPRTLNHPATASSAAATETRNSQVPAVPNPSSNITSFPAGSASPRSQQRKRQRTFPSATALSHGTSYLQPETSHGSHTNDMFATPYISLPVEGQPYPSLDNMPLEGHESMMWYDQLFASSFSAIDNPFLVNAEFDASVDPTWNSLR